MAGFARDIMSYKYYMDDVSGEETNIIETYLYAEKKRAPSRYPYVFFDFFYCYLGLVFKCKVIIMNNVLGKEFNSSF